MTAPVFPAAAPMLVPVKPCCGLLPGDECDCAAFAAEFLAALSTPLVWPRPLTDPALQVWRPGPDMVAAMCPPIRWSVTAQGIEVSL